MTQGQAVLLTSDSIKIYCVESHVKVYKDVLIIVLLSFTFHFFPKYCFSWFNDAAIAPILVP